MLPIHSYNAFGIQTWMSVSYILNSPEWYQQNWAFEFPSFLLFSFIFGKNVTLLTILNIPEPELYEHNIGHLNFLLF